LFPKLNEIKKAGVWKEAKGLRSDDNLSQIGINSKLLKSKTAPEERIMGRGSAVGSALVVAAVIGLVMMSQLESVEAAVYTVGDAGGWTFNVQDWPNGKHFRAGDTLIMENVIIYFPIF
ncbi:Basic blue protein, partial [Cucurbita argyrosperma subsp. argyrosperma]